MRHSFSYLLLAASVSDSAKKKKKKYIKYIRFTCLIILLYFGIYHISFQGLLPLNIYAQILHLMPLNLRTHYSNPESDSGSVWSVNLPFFFFCYPSKQHKFCSNLKSLPWMRRLRHHQQSFCLMLCWVTEFHLDKACPFASSVETTCKAALLVTRQIVHSEPRTHI